MNILIPHQWLLQHLKTNAKAEDIQNYLSLSGPSVEEIYDEDGDKVYDIEVTTNRPDAMSVRGIAREAAVILNRYDIPAELKPLELKEDIEPKKKPLPLPKINNDPSLCKRILCVVLSNVKHRPTPGWMADRLHQAGFQTHHSIIDITNYLTHDLGHPCHAFDYDKVMELGGVINVVEAKPGKPFETLDNAVYETVGGEIVFTNDVGTIIDLPAIIGTKNSSVDEETKNVLLLLESLDPQKVRQASMEHAIRTMAAQLNEKNIDPHLAMDVLLRGIQLYQKVTKAKAASEIFDDFPQPRNLSPVKLPKQLITDYLGVELETDQIVEILTKLGCQVETEQIEQAELNQEQTEESQKSQEQLEKFQLNQTLIKVQPPSFRPDLQIPADIIEEIARIYGYQELPSKLMTSKLPVNQPKNTTFDLEYKIKQFLANIGWQEVYSLSMVSQEEAAQSAYPVEDHLALSNPLLTDNTHLRRSLIPSLQTVLAENPQAADLSVFELANIYHPQDENLPAETMKLGMVSGRDYRRVRGDLEALLNQFYIKSFKVFPEEAAGDYLQQGRLLASGLSRRPENNTAKEPKEQIELGQVFVLNNQNIGFELDIQALAAAASQHPRYFQPHKTNPIIEDLTFTLTLDSLVGRVMDAILEVDDLVVKTELKDIYQQNHTFRIEYQHPQENLTSEEIAPVREKIVEKVKEQFGAKLVGQI